MTIAIISTKEDAGYYIKRYKHKCKKIILTKASTKNAYIFSVDSMQLLLNKKHMLFGLVQELANRDIHGDHKNKSSTYCKNVQWTDNCAR